MSEPIRVAILGFSAFERNAIATYFKLGSRRMPSYEPVLDVDGARFIVADADHAGAVSLLRSLERTGDAVFIGAHGPPDAAAWLLRPINPAHVLRELDALVAQRDHPDSEPLPLSLPIGSDWPGLSEPSQGRRAADQADAEMLVLQRREVVEARRRQRAAALRPQVLRRALLVDDSEIALHFLRRQLELYGLDTDFARSSDQAIELLSRRPYGMVFIDVDLGEGSTTDGLTLAHHIRRRLPLPGDQTPVLVMVSAFHDPVDQVRGTLAGADAYLGKPLDFGALDRLLQSRGFSRIGSLPPPPPEAGGPDRSPTLR